MGREQAKNKNRVLFNCPRIELYSYFHAFVWVSSSLLSPPCFHISSKTGCVSLPAQPAALAFRTLTTQPGLLSQHSALDALFPALLSSFRVYSSFSCTVSPSRVPMTMEGQRDVYHPHFTKGKQRHREAGAGPGSLPS